MKDRRRNFMDALSGRQRLMDRMSVVQESVARFDDRVSSLTGQSTVLRAAVGEVLDGVEASGQSLGMLHRKMDALSGLCIRIEQHLEDGHNRSTGIEARIVAIAEQLGRLEQRLEEAIAYFALRANRTIDSQAIYLGDHTAVTFLEGGLRILVDTRSVDIGVHLLTLGRWETAYTTLFTRMLRPGDTVLDIGANHGVYALLAAQKVGPAGRVHAFEPNPRLAHLLDTSLRLNGFAGWAQSHCVAVSGQAGTARIFFTDSFSGGASLGGSEGQQDASGETKHGVDCRLVPLDEMFADRAFQVNVIKMDVEGHEGPALRGMRGLLERSPDVKLMMEFAPEMMAGSGVAAPAVVAFLKELGFAAWLIDHEGGIAPVAWGDLAAQQGGVQNILAARVAPF